ncbi:MAG: PLDc N-terminal domain-containing protein, partial [Paludibacteraceae bacterium]|nr:PLDc N-terminal domain-containing protein [Paludibacteraceae bacterium]
MELFWQILYYSFTALYVYTALVVLTAILLENRNPVKTLGWIMVMILFPIVG